MASVKTTLENLVALTGLGCEEFLVGEVSRALTAQIGEAFTIWMSEIRAEQARTSRLPPQNGGDGAGGKLAAVTRILNEFVYPDVEFNALNYMEIFAPFLNYRQFVAKEFVQQCAPLIRLAIEEGFWF
jgi:hypothetical protein